MHDNTPDLIENNSTPGNQEDNSGFTTRAIEDIEYELHQDMENEQEDNAEPDGR
jgi:hypothetical protein